MIDGRYTQNGENVSPSLDWAKPPAGTRTLAVIVADAGVNRPEPIVHWIVYNIPSTMRHLSSQVVGDSSLPNGVMQGKNVSGKPGYIGPKPPAGQTHPYYFQVFALDRTLDIDPASADRTTLINAMKGHVLASGQRGRALYGPIESGQATAKNKNRPRSSRGRFCFQSVAPAQKSGLVASGIGGNF
jgi:Raf kinase inhibitor-like YbhB/YbcL family protein